MDSFTQAYIECALWASTDDNGEPLDNERDESDIAPETLATMVADCESFQADNAALLERWYSECSETPERAGQDFWLTRNHHGAGFWDRWNSGTPQGAIGKQLTDAAHAYGSCDLYVVDDSQVYCC
jgi:hypothetical protein